MTEPRFAVLDVVEIAGAGRGAVTSIRRYGDGSYRYSIGTVRPFPESEDDEVPGLYDEQQLQPTGERAEAERYGPIPPFRLRDVVRISPDCEVPEARGGSGYVHSAYDERPDEKPIGIWVYELEELCILDATELTRTGERLPPPPREQAAGSTRVGVDGAVLGHDDYVLVDDLEHYL
ncbi:MAG TPA: hypothetical protein VHC49_22540 [Mycobacteriales bacterium]|nr:hypothetical protein [Mycobacteriales bacterium]